MMRLPAARSCSSVTLASALGPGGASAGKNAWNRPRIVPAALMELLVGNGVDQFLHAWAVFLQVGDGFPMIAGHGFCSTLRVPALGS